MSARLALVAPDIVEMGQTPGDLLFSNGDSPDIAGTRNAPLERGGSVPYRRIEVPV